MENESAWESWISREESEQKKTSYDKLLDLAIDTYELHKRSRKMDLKDRVQFLCLWWFSNRRFMKYYYTYQAFGSALRVDHSTILHHVHKRIKSADYDLNTNCLNDFLNS